MDMMDFCRTATSSPPLASRMMSRSPSAMDWAAWVVTTMGPAMRRPMNTARNIPMSPATAPTTFMLTTARPLDA